MRDGSADGEQGEAGAGSSPTLSQAEDAGASGPAPQGAPQRRTTEAGPQRAVSNSEAQGSGRGAKPSCGLVHLNKAFVELHFAGQGLPQTVWVQVNVDGRDFSVRLPGQVYSTSCGQDHWLLGLQYVFKVHKDPLISRVEMGPDRTLRVTINSRGRQDKFASPNSSQADELLRALEVAAVKAAETAVMKRQGRVQVTGPNINVPKKQLRAQWPALLTACAPTEVTAHIWLDDSDSYISCPAKIILTKAKAEPVFYLAGLSSLLKNYTGAYASLELVAEQQLVRVHLDTNTKHLQAALGGAAGASSNGVAVTAAAAAGPAAASAPAAAAAGGDAPGGGVDRGVDEPAAVAAAARWDAGAPAPQPGVLHHLQQQRQGVAAAAKPTVHAGVPITDGAAGTGAVTPPLPPAPSGMTLSGGPTRPDMAPAGTSSAHAQLPVTARDRHQQPQQQQQQQQQHQQHQHQHQRAAAHAGAAGLTGGLPHGPAPVSWPIAAATAAGAAPPAAAGAWRAPAGYAAADVGMAASAGGQLGWSRKRPYAAEALYQGASAMDWCGSDHQHLQQQQQQQQMVVSPRFSAQRMIPPGTAAAAMGLGPGHATSGFSTGQVSLDMPAEVAPSMVPPSAHVHPMLGQHMMSLVGEGYSGQGWPQQQVYGGPPAYASHAAAMEEALEHQALHYQHQQWQSAYEVEARRRSAAGVMYDAHHYPQHHTVQQYPYAHYEQQPYGTAGYDSSHLQVPTVSAAAAARAAGAGQGFATAAVSAAGTAGALHASTPHWPKADQSGGRLMDKQGGAPSSSSTGKAAAAAAGNAVKAERGPALAANAPLPLSTTGLTSSAAGRAQAAGRDKPAGAGAHHMVTIPSSAALAAAAALVPMSAEAAAQLSYHHRGLSQDGLNLLATHALLELANDGAPHGAAAAAHTGAGTGALGGDGVGPVLKKRRLQRSRITCPYKLRQQLLLLTLGVADAAAEGAAAEGAAAGAGAGGSLRDVDMVPVGGTPNLGTSPPAAGGAAAAAGGGSCVGAGMRLPRVSSPDEVTTGFHLVGTGAPAAGDTPTAGGTSARRLSDKDTQQWRDQRQPHLQQRQQDKLPAVAGGKAAAGSTPPTPDSHVHFPLSPMASGSGRRTSTTSSAAAAAAAAAVAAVDVSNDAAGMQHRMAPQSELTRGQLGHQSHLAGGALVRDTPQSSDTGSTVDDPNMLVAAAGADGDTRAAAAWAGAAAAAAAAAAQGTSRAGEQEAVCSSRQGGVARQLLLPSVSEALQPQQEAYWRRRAAAAVAAASRRAAAAGGSTSHAGGTGPYDGVVHRLEKVSLQQPALPALFLPKRGCHSGDGRSPSFAAGGAAGRLEMASSYPPAAAAGGGGSVIRGGHAGGPLRGAGASAPLPTTRPTAAAAGSAGGGVYRRTRPTPLELPGTPPGWAAAPAGVPGMALPGAPRGGYGHPSEYTLMPPTPAANIAPWSGLEEDPYGAAGSWALASGDPAAAAAALKQQINACLAAPPVVGRVSEERRRRYYEAAATAASIQNLCAARAQQRPALPPYPLQHSAAQVAAPGDDLATLGNAHCSRPYAASAAMGTYSPAAMTAGVGGVSGSGAPYALSSSRALPWGPEQQRQRQVEYHDPGPWYASSEGGWAQQVSAHGAAAHLTRLPHPGAAAAAMAAAAAAGGAAHSLAAAVTLPMAGTGGGDVEMGSGLPNQASDRASTAVAGVPPLLEQKSSGPSSAAPGSCHLQGAAAGEGAGGMRAPHPGGSSWHGAGGRQAEAYQALPPPAWGEPGAGYGAPGAGYGAMYWEDPAAAAAASAWAAGVLSSASPKCPHARRRRMLLMQEARLLAASYSGHAASEPAHQQLGSYSGQQQPSGGNHTSPAWLEQPAPPATAAASSGGHARGMPPARGAGGGPASQAGPQLQQQGSVERPGPPGSSCSMGGPGVTSSRAMAMSPTLGAPAPGASPRTAAAAAGALQDAGAGEVVGAVDESGWPLLPDAANLVEVGRALVTVMNFLNAPSSDRLALTRTLRTMTPPDREWLLSFTYPYLQDACARRALPELQGIIRDILSGAHAATAAAEAAAAGGGTAPTGAAHV